MKILRESSKILVLNRMYNSNSSSNTNWKIIKNNKLSKIYNIYRKTQQLQNFLVKFRVGLNYRIIMHDRKILKTFKQYFDFLLINGIHF